MCWHPLTSICQGGHDDRESFRLLYLHFRYVATRWYRAPEVMLNAKGYSQALGEGASKISITLIDFGYTFSIFLQ